MKRSYSFLTAAQKYEVGKREAEHGVATTIRYYGKVAISPDLVRKESGMRKFKNAYRERSKLFHKEVLLRQWELALQTSLYSWYPSPHLTLQTRAPFYPGT